MREEPLLAQTRRLLRRRGLTARRGLGQHFLVDGGVLPVIVQAAGLTGNDTVIEVGPGLGILTRELAKTAGRVIAVELDDRLAAVLRETLGGLTNVTVINRNILDAEPSSLTAAPYKVVANLPYYITSPVLRHFLEAAVKPERLVLMVQREVAEVIAAGPGKLSLLAVSVQFYGSPEIVRRVSASSFFPVPEVDSAVIRIDVYPRPAVAVDDEQGFFRLVRAGFSGKRKQLANSLSGGLCLPKAGSRALLESAGIDPQRRPATLTLEEWAALWRAWESGQRGTAC